MQSEQIPIRIGQATKEKVMNNLGGHPETMKKRHEDLDRKIDGDAARIGADDLETARRKKERLALKDRIEGIG